MDPDVKRRFEIAAKALGKREYEVVDELLKGWLVEVEGQLRLARFFDEPRPIMIQADRVNVITEKVNVAFLKKEIAKLLYHVQMSRRAMTSVLADIRDNDTHHGLLGKLERALEKAGRVPFEARDEELQELVASAEKEFQ